MSILSSQNIPIEELIKPENKTIMVIGTSDTGKTSVIEELINLLTPQNKIGIVDCDTGQSHLGPPTTITWGMAESNFTSWDNIKVRDFYFTGFLSPADNLLSALTGLKLIYDKAEKSSDKVMIDTSGFIEKPSGKILKENQIELIKPQIILTLQKEKELEFIFDTFSNTKNLKIYNISVPQELKYKTSQERVDYRQQQFIKYFKILNRLELNLKYIGIKNVSNNFWGINSNQETANTQPLKQKQEFTNRLISLRNEYGEDIALGLIDSIDFNNNQLVALSPLSDENKVKSIVVGNINLIL